MRLAIQQRLGGLFENFVRFAQVLFAENGLIERMIANEPFDRIGFIREWRMRVWIQGALTVGLVLLVDPEKFIV